MVFFKKSSNFFQYRRIFKFLKYMKKISFTIFLLHEVEIFTSGDKVAN